MTSMQKEQVSARLKTLRHKLGLSQTEMGRITGQGAFYGNIERGSDVYNEMAIVKIADALGCDEDWLLTGSGSEPDYDDMRAKVFAIPFKPTKIESQVDPIPEPETRKPARSSIPDPAFVGARDPEPEPEQPASHRGITIEMKEGTFEFKHPNGFLQTIMITRHDVGIGFNIIDNAPKAYHNLHPYTSIDDIRAKAEILQFAVDKAEELLK